MRCTATGVAPKVCVLSGKVWDKSPVGVASEKHGLGAGEQSGALVNLIEGVGADDARITLVTIHHRLGDGEKGLPGAANRQDKPVRIEAGRGELKAVLCADRLGLAQWQ